MLTRSAGHKEFRDTEIERTPKDWNVSSLGDIALDVYRYPTYFNISYVDKGVPEVRGELVKENGELEEDLGKYRFISEKTSRKFPRTILKEGDFVLSVRGTMGKVALVPQKLIGANITANLIRISLDCSKCYSPFFKQFFLSDGFKRKLDEFSSQTTIKTIQAPRLKSIKAPVPSLVEQQKIAEILQTIDNIIDKTKDLIEKHKKIKQGLMQDLFSKNGLISIEFNEVIDEILDFRGKTPRKLGMEWGKGDILALSANNVKMGYVDPNAEAYYASEKLYRKWMNRGKPEQGDILLTMEAPLGNVAQIPDDRKYILSQRVILIKPRKEKIENEYLAHFLRSDFFQKQLMKFSSGTTAIGIQQAKLIKLTILYPEKKEEQKEIATVLTMMDNTINSQELCLSKLIKMKAGLMQDLLTGKVRVAA